MKIQGTILVVGFLAMIGCNAGDTKVETYKAAPNQVTDPNAPPVQPGNAKSMKESIQGNPNMPQAAKDALLRGGAK